MTPAELKTLTLARALDLIRKKQLSPVELTEAVLQRIEAINSQVGVFITVTSDEARKQARSAAQGALQGIPIAVKDLFDTKGIRTTAGSRVYANRIPAEDAVVVQKLKGAGAVLVGKTNLHEFAFGVTNDNPHYGAVRNPWDPNRVAGGSSGGSAAAVALSLALGATGTDTGGSIRIPASLCGVVGLKPTYGLVSTQGVIPLSESLDHCGPLTRTVEDAAVLLDVIAATHTALESGVSGLRIGVPRSYFFDRVNPEVHAAVRNAIRALGKLGAELVDIDLPSARLQQDIFTKIACTEAYAYHRPLLEKYRDLYGADILPRIEMGKTISSADYFEAQRMRQTMKDECDRAFQTVDVIATPTTPITAPLIAQLEVQWDDGAEPVAMALTRLTRPFNLVGLPAISIPCGMDSQGLPIGLQFAGRAFEESTVLRVANTVFPRTWHAGKPTRA